MVIYQNCSGSSQAANPNRDYSTDSLNPVNNTGFNVQNASGYISTVSSDVQIFDDYEFNTSTSETKNSDFDSMEFANIHNSIARMQELSEWEEMYLEKEIGDKATKVLFAIENYLNFGPPQIINEGGEELTFFWMDGHMERFISVSDDEIGHIIMNTNTYEGCTDIISKEYDFNIIDFLSYFHDVTKPETLTS